MDDARETSCDGGYLGRRDLAVSGVAMVLSGRDGRAAPAWLWVSVNGGPPTADELAELIKRLND